MKPARLAVLAEGIHANGGLWTTLRVRRFYLAAGVDAPKLATARRDLARLARDGILTTHNLAGTRFYTAKAPPRGEE